jgi:hypothetical protein
MIDGTHPPWVPTTGRGWILRTYTPEDSFSATCYSLRISARPGAAPRLPTPATLGGRPARPSDVARLSQDHRREGLPCESSKLASGSPRRAPEHIIEGMDQDEPLELLRGRPDELAGWSRRAGF